MINIVWGYRRYHHQQNHEFLDHYYCFDRDYRHVKRQLILYVFVFGMVINTTVCDRNYRHVKRQLILYYFRYGH